MPLPIVILIVGSLALASFLWSLPALWWSTFTREGHWDRPLTERDEPARRNTVQVRQVVAGPVVDAGSGSGQWYPTLEAIDRLRGEGHPALAPRADADALERQARELIDQSWSEQVWLTGCIDQGHLDALCASLEQQRHPTGSDVETVVVHGLPSGTTSPAR